MPTDLAIVRGKLIAERTLVVEMITLFDLADELARFEAAEATLKAAQVIFDKKSRRWTLINEKLEQLAELDDQIALVAP